MSSDLMRMALRLSAVAALRGKTSAGDNVADSFIGATEFQEPQNARPFIAIYTEQEDGAELGSYGGPPFIPQVELVVEVTMIAAIYDAELKQLDVAIPATDAELERSIDIVHFQIEHTLFRSFDPLAQLFQKIAKFPRNKQSIRFVSPKDGIKLAKRYAVYKIEIDDPEMPISTPANVLTGLDLLPEPFCSVAKAWPDGPEKDAANLAAAALAQPTISMLTGIDAKINIQPIQPDDKALDAYDSEHPAPTVTTKWDAPT